MSDLSIIAHDYALNADFARAFNEAVLKLKRRYLVGRAPAEAEADLVKARTELRNLLESLIPALQNDDKPWTADQARVPTDVVERLRSRLKAELPQTVVDLRQVIGDLNSGAALNAASFAPLDRVCEAADATASAAFRRLRRI